MSVDELCQKHSAGAMQQEATLTFIRLACSFDGPKALAHLSAFDSVWEAFRRWLFERPHAQQRVAAWDALDAHNAHAVLPGVMTPVDVAVAALLANDCLPCFLASSTAKHALDALLASRVGEAAAEYGRMWDSPQLQSNMLVPLADLRPLDERSTCLPTMTWVYQHVALGLALPLMLTLADASNAILFANDAFCDRTGYPPSEALGRDWRTIARDHDAGSEGVLQQSLHSRIDCILELTLVRQSGEELPVLVGVRPLGEVTRLILTVYVELTDTTLAAHTARKLAKLMKLLPE